MEDLWKILLRIKEVKFETENESCREWSSRKRKPLVSRKILWCYILKNYHKLRERKKCYGEFANFFQFNQSSWTHRWKTFYLWNTRRAENYGISQFPAMLFCTVSFCTSLPLFSKSLYEFLHDCYIGKIIFRAWVQSHRRKESLSDFWRGKHLRKAGLCSCYQTTFKDCRLFLREKTTADEFRYVKITLVKKNIPPIAHQRSELPMRRARRTRDNKIVIVINREDKD